MFYEKMREKIAPSREALRETLAVARAGKTLVFTNGCFDILHPGHVSYLSRARDLGDALIVGVNSDESVQKLNKGPGRPVNSAPDRALLLASLACVDYVFVFSEDTPERSLEILRPEIHVKGGDYAPDDLPEKKTVESYGGQVVILPFLPGHSTTGIIGRLQQNT